MKLCIPVSGADGLQSVIEPHLPSAEHLLFFDTENRQLEHVSLLEARGEGEGDGRVRMDAVLCGSINRVTLRLLIEQGIKVYGTEARVVAQAIEQFENGELVAAVMGASGCRGHADSHAGGCCSGDGHGQDDTNSGRDSHGGHRCAGEGGCSGHGHAHDSGACRGRGAHQDDAVGTRPRGDVLGIAVSSQNRKSVTEHAGKCRKFWIYEVVNGQVSGKTLLELPIEQSLHECAPGEAHPLDKINVLISGSMGSGLKEKLLQRGIRGVVTQETDPDRAVASLLSGETQSFPPNRAWVQRCSHDDDRAHVCGAAV